MNLVERVKAILLQPKSEWAVIERRAGRRRLSVHELCRASSPPSRRCCAFIGGVDHRLSGRSTSAS